MNTKPPYLTDQQIADHFNISVETVRKHRQKRIGFPSYKIGGCVRYKLEECEAFLQNTKAGA